MSRTDNQFGRWRFDKVIIDFKPHVNCDIRDYWMSYYQGFSAVRPFFNWVLMPTVDSAPQQEQWIETFIGADAIFTYSDWAADVLKKQSDNQINYIDTVSPGVDLNTFIPKNKKELRNKYNIPNDAIIIGSVMRNQKRKLIPELLSSVRQLIDRLYEEESPLANKIYLYLHTSYPDAGWDIPELLKETRMSNRTLFTYKCNKCDNVSTCFYTGPNKICNKCFGFSSRFISVSAGVSNEALSDIYNLFDLYVQYSICEGFGLPQIEAGACGIPVATVNYSAMVDIINKLEAYPIEIGSYFKELETKAIRVYPSNTSLVDIIHNHIHLPEIEKLNKSKRIRYLTELHYSWDKIADKWENFFDSSPWLFTSKKSWNDAPNLMRSYDKKIDNPKYVINEMINICGNHMNNIDLIKSLPFLDMCRDTSYGFTQSGTSFDAFGDSELIRNLNTMINNHNQIEYVRANNISFDDDFIQYAKLKASL
jgi:glycosyltransferase involved in cell wall biosynthesis